METAQDLDGSAATLRSLAHLRRTKLEVERDILRAAVRYAEIRNGETAGGARPDGRVMPGMERSMTLGGPGTPEVAEFAVADVAAELEISPYAARSLWPTASTSSTDTPGSGRGWTPVRSRSGRPARSPRPRAVSPPRELRWWTIE